MKESFISPDKLEAIEMRDVLPALSIFCIGIILSGFLFLLEMIYEKKIKKYPIFPYLD